MSETVRLDGVDVALTPDSVASLFAERKRQYEELRGKLDASSLELEKEKVAREGGENPHTIESKVQGRLSLIEKCRRILGDDVSLYGKTDDELKLLGIHKFYPDVDLSGKDHSYIDGMFEAISSKEERRNDSLTNTRQAILLNEQSKINRGYEAWLEQSAKMWTLPLAGSR